MNRSISVINDKKPVTHKWTVLEQGLNKLIYNNFQNYKDFFVISNIKKYKPSMDKYIFAQKIGKTAEIAEVYLKGEYLCDVSIFDTPSQALTKIQDGVINLLSKKGD